MIELASHIVDLSLEHSKYIQQLQLQSITYYTILKGLKLNLINEDCLRELYKYKSDRFIPSRYGPRSEVIFLHYSIFGAGRIFTNHFKNISEQQTDFSHLNDIILPLLEEKTRNLWEQSIDNPIFKKRFESHTEFSIEDIILLSEGYSDLK